MSDAYTIEWTIASGNTELNCLMRARVGSTKAKTVHFSHSSAGFKSKVRGKEHHAYRNTRAPKVTARQHKAYLHPWKPPRSHPRPYSRQPNIPSHTPPTTCMHIRTVDVDDSQVAAMRRVLSEQCRVPHTVGDVAVTGARVSGLMPQLVAKINEVSPIPLGVHSSSP